MRDTAFAPGAEGMIDIAIRGERYGSRHYRIADWSDGSVRTPAPGPGPPANANGRPWAAVYGDTTKDYFV
jgi:hypothetical protein